MASKHCKGSNAWLRRQFARINKKFFGGRLDPNTHVRYGKSTYLGEAGFEDMTCDRCGNIGQRPDILINEKLRWSRSLSGPTLVHEMVHVEHPEWTKHRGKFDTRLEGLVKKGAMRGWL